MGQTLHRTHLRQDCPDATTYYKWYTLTTAEKYKRLTNTLCQVNVRLYEPCTFTIQASRSCDVDWTLPCMWTISFEQVCDLFSLKAVFPLESDLFNKKRVNRKRGSKDPNGDRPVGRSRVATQPHLGRPEIYFVANNQLGEIRRFVTIRSDIGKRRN